MRNKTTLDEVIGTGSLHNWTRKNFYDEYNLIVKAAENGGNSTDEWESMQKSLATMYTCTSCERMQELIRLFLYGRFSDLKIESMWCNLRRG